MRPLLRFAAPFTIAGLLSFDAWSQPAQKPAPEAPPAKSGPADAKAAPAKQPKAPEKKAAAPDKKAQPEKKKAAAPPADAPPADEPPLLPGGDAPDAAAEKAAADKAAADKAAADKAAAEKAAADKAAAEKALQVAAGGAGGDSAAGQAKTTPVPDRKGQKVGDGTENDTHVFAEDWWTSARPVFEVHGYYRVRTEFMSHFALGRKDTPASTMWPQPADNSYVDTSGGVVTVKQCGDKPNSQDTAELCDNNVQAGANMRFRISPELHISDNIRVMAQLDLLDNVVLGSTPEGYVNEPGSSGSYQVRARGGYTPIGAFSTTQYAPSAGQNSLTDSIVVKRVWGEYMTPIGQLRFGRMPSSFGLGMLVNAGDGPDSDYASSADRIMFVTGIKSWDLYFGGLWDFANEGATSSLIGERQGQAYDLAQSDDVNQWGLVIARRRNAELAKLDLAKGLPVVNGGVYGVYRQQSLDATTALGANASDVSLALTRRGAQAVIPDFWFQFMFNKFRFEAEAAMVWGGIQNTSVKGVGTNNFQNPNDPSGNNDGWNIRQFGFTAQSEFRAFDDKLRIMVGGGYATGDDDVEGLAPPAEGFDAQLTHNRTFSTFRFHPDYRIDLILFRNILQRIQGAYYLRPSVEYDFKREADGQRIGGGAALIWSRASQPVQAPGNSPDLGLELNFKVYYQASDGALNDDPDKMGGFFTQLEYGVMFPLGGLGYLPGEEEDLANANRPADISTAQTVRWFLGIVY